MTDILMPALSPTMEEGKRRKWLKKVGDTVKSGDVIAEIETDKATMEVEAVDEGTLTQILVPDGTEGVKVNTPIAVLSDGAGSAKRRARSRNAQRQGRRHPAPAPAAAAAEPNAIPAQPKTPAARRPGRSGRHRRWRR